MPDWIVSFDIGDTIRVDALASYAIECSSDVQSGTIALILRESFLIPVITVSPGDRVAVFSSGRSNDQQNLQGMDNRVKLQLGNGYLH